MGRPRDKAKGNMIVEHEHGHGLLEETNDVARDNGWRLLRACIEPMTWALSMSGGEDFP